MSSPHSDIHNQLKLSYSVVGIGFPNVFPKKYSGSLTHYSFQCVWNASIELGSISSIISVLSAVNGSVTSALLHTLARCRAKLNTTQSVVTFAQNAQNASVADVIAIGLKAHSMNNTMFVLNAWSKQLTYAILLHGSTLSQKPIPLTARHEAMTSSRWPPRGSSSGFIWDVDGY